MFTAELVVNARKKLRKAREAPTIIATLVSA
jgi:hypothetical protein